MKLKIKKFKRITDFSGSLIPIYKDKSLNQFNIKRFFFIYGKKKFIRAEHAHRKCNQILIPVNGKVEVEIFNLKKIKKTFTLSDRNKSFLFIPSFHFIRIKFKQEKSILLTLCDYKYDKKEYIFKKEFFNF
jgi:UDP-2-acetamido-3-amino-2,3-dideoxy-glucuronate N-acetyltransferase